MLLGKITIKTMKFTYAIRRGYEMFSKIEGKFENELSKFLMISKITYFLLFMLIKRKVFNELL